MAQYSLPNIDAATDTGTTLTNYLNAWRPAVNTNHSGSARPSYAVAGMIWVQDTIPDEATIYFYDGIQDIMLFVVDTATGQIVSGGGGGGNGAVVYRGALDPTQPAPAAVAGDFYISNTAGNADATFSGIGGQAVGVADMLIFDGAFWSSFPNTVDLTGYLNLSGGTMTGPLILAQDPIAPMEAATRQWVESLGTGSSLPLTGGTMAGDLILNGAPTVANQAANKGYVDQQDALRLPLTGGTLTGQLILSGAPGSSLAAATKNYVDNFHDPQKLNLAGGTLTGELVLAGDGVNPFNPVSLQQMQTATVAVVQSAGSPDAAKLVKTNALGKIDNSLISVSTGFTYGGQVNPAAVAPAQQNGVYYILSIDGTFHASYGAPLAGTIGNAGDVIISNGSTWEFSPVSQSGTQYVDKDAVNTLGPVFKLVGDTGGAHTLIDGIDAALNSVANLNISGGTFSAPNNRIGLLYTDTSGNAPGAALIPGGALGINRADLQLFSLDSASAVQPLIGITRFATTGNYVAGTLVARNNRLLSANNSVSAGAFSAPLWRDITPGVGSYSSAAVYHLDDLVAYAGGLYRCLANDTGPEAFTPSNWEAIDSSGFSANSISNGNSNIEIVGSGGVAKVTINGVVAGKFLSTGLLVYGKSLSTQEFYGDFTEDNEFVSKLYVDTGLADKANTVHSHTSANISDFDSAASALVTYGTLNTNGDVGAGAGQLAIGNHTHSNYQPLDSDLTAIAALGAPVSGDGVLYKTSGGSWVLHTGTFAETNQITYETLNANGDVGSSAGQLAIGNHTHNYVPLVASTDNRIARFNGAGGALQNSGATIDDSGYMYCTTPPGANNDTSVATTAWVRSFVGGGGSYLPLSGGTLTGQLTITRAGQGLTNIEIGNTSNDGHPFSAADQFTYLKTSTKSPGGAVINAYTDEQNALDLIVQARTPGTTPGDLPLMSISGYGHNGSGGRLTLTGNETILRVGGNSYFKANGRLDNNGISFDNGANILDEFNEQFFSVTLVGTSTPGTINQTNTCNCLRIGNLVHVLITMNITSVPVAPTGNLRLDGLPYTVAAVVGVCSVRTTGFSTGAVFGEIHGNSVAIYSRDANQNRASAVLGGGGTLLINATYRTV